MARGFTGASMTVPAEVPSVAQSSVPWTPSSSGSNSSEPSVALSVEPGVERRRPCVIARAERGDRPGAAGRAVAGPELIRCGLEPSCAAKYSRLSDATNRAGPSRPGLRRCP